MKKWDTLVQPVYKVSLELCETVVLFLFQEKYWLVFTVLVKKKKGSKLDHQGFLSPSLSVSCPPAGGLGVSSALFMVSHVNP